MKFSTVSRFILILTICSGLLIGCTDSGDTACSSSENCSDDTPTPSISNVKLNLDFEDSYYFDQQIGRWVTITKDIVKGGSLGQRVPIFSDFVTEAKDDATLKISGAKIQYENQELFTQEQYNKIPYIKMSADESATVIYNYKKIDPNGIEVGGNTGQAVKDGTTFYIPFVNSMFDDVFFPANTTSSQSSFTHKLQIVAQSPNTKGSDVHTITFNAQLVVPNKDFDIELSDAMKDLTIHNRWNHFYNINDGVANTDLELASLIEKSETPESIPLDIRVVFKTAPIIKMNYKIFDENNLAKATTDYNEAINIIRGYEFYEQSYELNSDSDFGFVFKINDNPVTLTNSNREAEIRDIPAGELWKLSFGYNLTQNPAYPSGKTLLKPLRPICNSIANANFSPITENDHEKSVEDLGGYVSICHPETFQKESIPSDQIDTTPLELKDTWFDSFSYMANKDESSNSESLVATAGHFYGVKSIDFNIEGCIKIYTREASASPTNPNAWELKNNESPECSSGPGDEDWMRFEITREVSIFDDMSQYESVEGLNELINTYRNAIPKTSPDMFFNGDTFFKHIH